MTEATPTTTYPIRRSLRRNKPFRLPRARVGFASLAITALLAVAAIPILSSTSTAAPRTSRPQAAQSLRVAGTPRPVAPRDSYSAQLAPKPKPKPKPVAVSSRTSVAGATTGRLAWPFGHPVRLSSPFGARSAPCAGCSSNHQGLDMVPGAGTPIMASAAGTVRTAEYGGALGNYVIVDHNLAGRRISTMYAHMASLPLVAPGQQITAGTVIGAVGSTGASTGPHLHFEVLLDGVTPVNPLPWLTS